MKSSGTPIAWPLRLWLAVEVLFGLGAVLAVGLSPADTETNFAWPIQPVVMAAVLGGFYMTSAPLFLLPLFARRWEMIRVMILRSCQLIQLATFFIGTSFPHGTFYVWFASSLPLLFVRAWHQSRCLIPLNQQHAST
jgi:hypothetical protein